VLILARQHARHDRALTADVDLVTEALFHASDSRGQRTATVVGSPDPARHA
jgi:hypothetical protein